MVLTNPLADMHHQKRPPLHWTSPIMEDPDPIRGVPLGLLPNAWNPWNVPTHSQPPIQHPHQSHFVGSSNDSDLTVPLPSPPPPPPPLPVDNLPISTDTKAATNLFSSSTQNLSYSPTNSTSRHPNTAVEHQSGGSSGSTTSPSTSSLSNFGTDSRQHQPWPGHEGRNGSHLQRLSSSFRVGCTAS